MYIDVLLRRLMIVLYSFVVSGAFIHFTQFVFDIFYFTQTKGQQISVISVNEMIFYFFRVAARKSYSKLFKNVQKIVKEFEISFLIIVCHLNR